MAARKRCDTFEEPNVMTALQKVEAVTVLALNKRVPEELEGKKLAEFIVGCIAPSASSASTAASSWRQKTKRRMRRGHRRRTAGSGVDRERGECRDGEHCSPGAA